MPRKIKLAPDLEKSLLLAIAQGVAVPDVVAPEELSKKGKTLHAAILYLLRHKAKPPLKPASIALTVSNLLGVEKKTVADYLRTFEEYETGPEINTILRAARDKALLVTLVNEAGGQLASGDLNVSSLGNILTKGTHGTETIKSLSERVGDRFPKPPVGYQVDSLAAISKATNGVCGIWIIGGEPGLGKSTLAWQLSLEVGSNIPVVYYDLDGTGYEYLVDRTRHIVGGDRKRFNRMVENLFLRETINTLEEDLSVIKPPALLVIDTPQTLPVSAKYQKQGLDGWIRRFKELRNQGYTLILISEKQRAQYGEVSLGGYKGTGDIEYAGTLCIQLLQNEDDDDLIEFHIMKNRHTATRGHIVNLERDSKKVFWFKEVKV